MESQKTTLTDQLATVLADIDRITEGGELNRFDQSTLYAARAQIAALWRKATPNRPQLKRLPPRLYEDF